jgi:predicted DNA binding CopG/RHH family protein
MSKPKTGLLAAITATATPELPPKARAVAAGDDTAATVHLTVRVAEAERRALKAKAAAEGRTVQDLIRQAVAQLIK